MSTDPQISLARDPDTVDALLHAVDRIDSDLRFHFHHLHRHPETSWSEQATAEYVEECLDSLDFTPRRLAETGVVIDVPGELELPRRALRADLDAIFVREATELPFASIHDGVMHACGHDAHTSILLGLAKVLRRLEDRPHRPLRLIFQPAEETLPSGSQRMIEEGVLGGVSDVVGLHVWPALSTGQVGLREGAVTAASDAFTIWLRGPGGHGARPHETADLVKLASRVIDGLLSIPSLGHDKDPPAVLSFGVMRGGEAMNVIPSEVFLQGTLRTLDEECRREIQRAMRKITETLSREEGATAEVLIDRGPPAVVNDERLLELGRGGITGLLGANAVVPIGRPSMGSEDFGHFLEHVPGVLLRLGSTEPGAVPHPLHSSRFRVDDRALRVGVLSLAAFVFS